MPWSNQAVTLIVLVEQVSGFSGVFAYSPVPAKGNLIASIAAGNGTDPFGNSYFAGFVTYVPAASPVFYAQLNQGLLKVAGSGASWEIATLNADLLIEPASGGAVYAQNLSSAASAWVGAQLNAVSTPETWHTMGLSAGFAALAGFAAPAYRFEPIGSGGVVRLRGALSLTANQAVGTAFFTMPATYRPSFSQYFLTGNSLSGGVGTEVESVRVINATGGGALELGSNGSTGNYVLLEGITYPLD